MITPGGLTEAECYMKLMELFENNPRVWLMLSSLARAALDHAEMKARP